jgi:CDGSH-type Zn-finger protein
MTSSESPGDTVAAAAAMQVRVLENGPYVVSGHVPLTRRRPVTSEDGEPITWQTTATLTTPATYALCRCGHSTNKPFCDGTHAQVGFDGTEAVPASGESTKDYAGVGITVRDDRSICQHAGFCGNRVTNVWKMIGESSNTRIRSELIAMVERCPSGALSYAIDDRVIEPDLRPAVRVVDDGPLAVTGQITLQRTDGSIETRARMTLCRCGRSDNKPFCDGSHVNARFRDSAVSDNKDYA